MVIKTIPNEVLIKLKEKYGANKLRDVARLYGSNIPEKHWYVEWDDDSVNDIVKSCADNIYKDERNYFITCSDVGLSNMFVSDILHRLIHKGKDCYRFNYAELISDYTDKFSTFNVSNFMKDIEHYEVIAITNVYANKFYQQTQHHFENIITNLTNSRLNKTLIINVLEYDEELNKETYTEAYGLMISSIMFNSKDSTIIGNLL